MSNSRKGKGSSRKGTRREGEPRDSRDGHSHSHKKHRSPESRTESRREKHRGRRSPREDLSSEGEPDVTVWLTQLASNKATSSQAFPSPSPAGGAGFTPKHHGMNGQSPIARPRNANLDGKSTFEVIARVRPASKSSTPSAVRVAPDARSLAVSHHSMSPQQPVVVDRVYQLEDAQQEIYVSHVQTPVRDAIESESNGTFIAYGQKNSGKTTTIMGKSNKRHGLVFYAVSDVFRWVEAEQMRDINSFYEVGISYLEVGGGMVLRDIIGGPGSRLQMEATSEGVQVHGLSKHFFDNAHNLMKMLQSAERSVGDDSPCHHSVLTIYIEKVQRNGGPHRISKLNFVDLAARNFSTDTDKDLEDFGEKLCRSIANGAVPRPSHLASQLGLIDLLYNPRGNTKTVIIVCFHPAVKYYWASLNSLAFARHMCRVKTNGLSAAQWSPFQANYGLDFTASPTPSELSVDESLPSTNASFVNDSEFHGDRENWAVRNACFRYYRWKIFSAAVSKSPLSRPEVCVSQIKFYQMGKELQPAAVTATSGGTQPSQNGPSCLLDGRADTCWVETATPELIFDFGAPVNLSTYEWFPVHNRVGSPETWVFEGSVDQDQWYLLDKQNEPLKGLKDRRASRGSFSVAPSIADTNISSSKADGLVRSGLWKERLQQLRPETQEAVMPDFEYAYDEYPSLCERLIQMDVERGMLQDQLDSSTPKTENDKLQVDYDKLQELFDEQSLALAKALSRPSIASSNSTSVHEENNEHSSQLQARLEELQEQNLTLARQNRELLEEMALERKPNLDAESELQRQLEDLEVLSGSMSNRLNEYAQHLQITETLPNTIEVKIQARHLSQSWNDNDKGFQVVVLSEKVIGNEVTFIEQDHSEIVENQEGDMCATFDKKLILNLQRIFGDMYTDCRECNEVDVKFLILKVTRNGEFETVGSASVQMKPLLQSDGAELILPLGNQFDHDQHQALAAHNACVSVLPVISYYDPCVPVESEYVGSESLVPEVRRELFRFRVLNFLCSIETARHKEVNQGFEQEREEFEDKIAKEELKSKTAQTEKDALATELDKATAELKEIQAAHQLLSSDLQERQRECEWLVNQTEERDEKIANLLELKDQNEKTIEEHANKVEMLEGHNEQLLKNVEVHAEKLNAAHVQSAADQEHRTLVLAQHKEKEEVEQLLRAELAASKQEKQQCKEDLEKVLQQLAGIQSTKPAIDIESVQGELDRFKQLSDDLAREKAATLNQLDAACADLENERDEALRDRDEACGQLRKLQDECELLRTQITDAGSQVDQMRTEKAQLEKEIVQHVELAEAAEKQSSSAQQASHQQDTDLLRRQKEELEDDVQAKDEELQDYYSQLEACEENIAELAKLNAELSKTLEVELTPDEATKSDTEMTIEVLCKISCRNLISDWQPDELDPVVKCFIKEGEFVGQTESQIDTDNPDFESLIVLRPASMREYYQVMFAVFDVDGGQEEVEIGRATVPLQVLLKSDGGVLSQQLGNKSDKMIDSKLREKLSRVEVTAACVQTETSSSNEPNMTLSDSFKKQLDGLRTLSKNATEMTNEKHRTLEEEVANLESELKAAREAREEALVADNHPAQRSSESEGVELQPELVSAFAVLNRELAGTLGMEEPSSETPKRVEVMCEISCRDLAVESDLDDRNPLVKCLIDDELIGQTETRTEDNDPKFDRAIMLTLSDPQSTSEIIFAVFDVDIAGSESEAEIGRATFTAQELAQSDGSALSLELRNPSDQVLDGKLRNEFSRIEVTALLAATADELAEMEQESDLGAFFQQQLAKLGDVADELRLQMDGVVEDKKRTVLQIHALKEDFHKFREAASSHLEKLRKDTKQQLGDREAKIVLLEQKLDSVTQMVKATGDDKEGNDKELHVLSSNSSSFTGEVDMQLEENDSMVKSLQQQLEEATNNRQQTDEMLQELELLKAQKGKLIELREQKAAEYDALDFSYQQQLKEAEETQQKLELLGTAIETLSANDHLDDPMMTSINEVEMQNIEQMQSLQKEYIAVNDQLQLVDKAPTPPEYDEDQLILDSQDLEESKKLIMYKIQEIQGFLKVNKASCQQLTLVRDELGSVQQHTQKRVNMHQKAQDVWERRLGKLYGNFMLLPHIQLQIQAMNVGNLEKRALVVRCLVQGSAMEGGENQFEDEDNILEFSTEPKLNSESGAVTFTTEIDIQIENGQEARSSSGRPRSGSNPQGRRVVLASEDKREVKLLLCYAEAGHEHEAVIGFATMRVDELAKAGEKVIAISLWNPEDQAVHAQLVENNTYLSVGGSLLMLPDFDRSPIARLGLDPSDSLEPALVATESPKSDSSNSDLEDPGNSSEAELEEQDSRELESDVANISGPLSTEFNDLTPDGGTPSFRVSVALSLTCSKKFGVRRSPAEFHGFHGHMTRLSVYLAQGDNIDDVNESDFRLIGSTEDAKAKKRVTFLEGIDMHDVDEWWNTLVVIKLFTGKTVEFLRETAKVSFPFQTFLEIEGREHKCPLDITDRKGKQVKKCSIIVNTKVSNEFD